MEIKATSVYLHSISILTFKSNTAFDVKLSYESLSIEKGVEKKREPGRFVVIESQQAGSNHFVIVSVIGLIEERTVIKDKKYSSILGNHYGMRFYPFVSSIFNGFIYCTSKIENVSIILPEHYRLLLLLNYPVSTSDYLSLLLNNSHLEKYYLTLIYLQLFH